MLLCAHERRITCSRAYFAFAIGTVSWKEVVPGVRDSCP